MVHRVYMTSCVESSLDVSVYLLIVYRTSCIGYRASLIGGMLYVKVDLLSLCVVACLLAIIVSCVVCSMIAFIF